MVRSRGEVNSFVHFLWQKWPKWRWLAIISMFLGISHFFKIEIGYINLGKVTFKDLAHVQWNKGSK